MIEYESDSGFASDDPESSSKSDNSGWDCALDLSAAEVQARQSGEAAEGVRDCARQLRLKEAQYR